MSVLIINFKFHFRYLGTLVWGKIICASRLSTIDWVASSNKVNA